MIVVFSPLPRTGGGGWGHHLPLLFSGLIQLPLVVALKMRRGAAELRPPRRLSLRSRAANFGQPLRQVHVQLGWEGMYAFVWCDFHRVGHGFGVFFLWWRSVAHRALRNAQYNDFESSFVNWMTTGTLKPEK